MSDHATPTRPEVRQFHAILTAIPITSLYIWMRLGDRADAHGRVSRAYLNREELSFPTHVSRLFAAGLLWRDPSTAQVYLGRPSTPQPITSTEADHVRSHS